MHVQLDRCRTRLGSVWLSRVRQWAYVACACLLAVSHATQSTMRVPSVQVTAIGGESMLKYSIDLPNGPVTKVGEISDRQAIDAALSTFYQALSVDDSQAEKAAEKLRSQLPDKVNRVVWSPDRRYVAAYQKDENGLTSTALWLIEAGSWKVLAESSIDNASLHVKWTPDSRRVVTLERKFVRNSFSPWNLFSALFGHAVGIYRYSLLVLEPASPKLRHRTEILTGAFHSAGFAWAP